MVHFTAILISISSVNDLYRLKSANFRRCCSAFLTIVKSYYGPLATGHYSAGGGGGRASMFWRRVTIFLASLWEVPFLKNDFEGRATNFLGHKYSVSIYLKSSHSQFSLFEPTVSVLCYGFKFWGPCRSRENYGDPATRLAKKKKNLTKVYNYGQKLSKRFTQTDYSNNKAHTLAIKLAIYTDIF